MGIEIWALVVLVVVLAVYLLPLLVGRREVMGLSRAQDRYSGNLRVLATGASAHVADDACANEVHAEIFKYRPEVRAMNRPAVRNVRALRTERELARARRAHQEGRERRRVAASRRAVVALVLLGVLAGTAVVSAVTVLPWWPVLVPGVLLAASMAVGRQAAVASAEADRRERRRVSRLEADLARLTGEVPAVQVTAEEPRAEAPTDAPSAQEAAPAEEASAGAVAEKVQEPVPAGELAAEPGSAAADKAPVAETVEVAETVGSSVRSTQEPTTATPPQGWTPVKVPAPTYTLVAGAPRRVVDGLEEPARPSAPVPMRPVAARAYLPLEEEAEVAAPIDLDAVLERRRAAGA
ncbi:MULTISPECIES: hypothetical protein [unclassified Actinomyces]|uniref:hypothetical protein n=1 Tax=unclassified Actinomyces TaxID=2609248 RepID=UPI0020175B72|nr:MULTISPECIES: hypothetical protein [unclassified Actinomyces]MCL3778740.1 hypothetical protein [Actinomyces sp. AC-20-1]MCL3789814.1 hypothetical protein [Actinomyces sp. 187325]MCL3792442.1 hypothetical protein [Actinomyces sp. 186855]MCL3794692.1 hypothetical protein [Actinomyces sp. 217892]